MGKASHILRDPVFHSRLLITDDHGYLIQKGDPPHLIVLDLSDPRHPREAGRVLLPPVFVGRDHNFGDLRYDGQQVFLEMDGFLLVIDVSDPGSPRVAHIIDPPPEQPFSHFLARNGHVYNVACADWDQVPWPPWMVCVKKVLGVLSLTDPEAPQFSMTEIQAFWLLGIVESYLYLTDVDRDLKAVDISEPSSPVVTKVLGEGDHDVSVALHSGITVVGSYAYVAGERAESPGLWILDISNPGDLMPVAWFPVGPCCNLVAAGSRGYLFTARIGWVGEYNIHILDLSVPTAPRLLESYLLFRAWLSYSTVPFALGDEYTLYALLPTSLRVFDVSGAPVEVGRYPQRWELFLPMIHR